MSSSSRTRSRALPSLVVVAVALFLDMLVYGLVVPVIPTYSARLGATPEAVGILFAIYGVALLAATPVVGALSRRVDRRALLLVGLGGVAASTFLFACSTSFAGLLAARALQGVAAAGSWVGGLALLADSVALEKRGRVFGIASTASALGTLCGPPLGGVMADHFGYRAPFFTVTALSVVACIGASLVLERSAATTRSTSTGPRLLLDARVRAICAFVALGAGLLGMLEPMLPLDITTRLGGSASQIGLMFAIASVAYGVVAPLIGWASDKRGAALPMRVGWVAAALMLPLVTLPRSMLVQAAAMAALGTALAAMLTPALRALSEATDRLGGDYGVAYAAYNATYAGGLMIGASAGGRLVGMLGTQRGLGVAMVAMFALGLAPAISLTRAR